MKEYVIGLDIGTTCTKALVVDESGQVVSQGEQGYRLISDGAKVEQRAEDWIEGAAAAIRKAVLTVDPHCVRAISLSTQGGSTVAVDREGNFLGNAWTWMDNRSVEEAQAVEERLGGETIYRTTGWRINPALDAAKLRRMKTMPQYAGAVKYFTTLEVLNGWLTGNPVIDPTNAAMRQLYSIEENDWSENLLQVCGVSREELPKVLPTGAPVGELRREAAQAAGLPAGIPVFNGAHDQYCAAVGSGSVEEGDMLLSAGTTWVLMGISKKPLFTSSYIAPGRHPVEGLYGAIASLVGSGASLQWFKNNFLPEEFEEMNQKAAQRRDKAAELFFFPYLAGAGYPLWNLNAKGVFAGITLEHDRFDFARAIMEGAAFGVRRAVEDFAANGAEIRTITAMGGAAKSPLWMELIASITGVPIRRMDQADVCALGAAVIAAQGIGMFYSYREAAGAMARLERIYEPSQKDAAWYQSKYQKAERLWKCLEGFYKI